MAGKTLSRRIVRRADGAGVPAARDGHVRAAGPSGRLPYPGAPPTPPYDNAGWTLAFQMGVQFDRDPRRRSPGRSRRVTDWNVAPPPGHVIAPAGAAGFVSSRRVNDAYLAVNRLLAQGARRHVARGRVLCRRVGCKRRAGCRSTRPISASALQGLRLRSGGAGRCARRASDCGTSTADRSSPGGRAGFSSSSSSRSSASSRPRSTRGI